MNRSEKDAVIQKVAEKVLRARGVYLTDFSSLTVAEETELRREFRKSGIEYTVLKNTLARKALERATGFDRIYDKLVGPTSMAFGYDDAIAPAKIIKKFSDKTGKLKLKVAVVEKEIFEGDRLDALATLPSKYELIAGIVGSLQAPAAGIAGAVNAVLRDLVSVIDQISKRKQAA